MSVSLHYEIQASPCVCYIITEHIWGKKCVAKTCFTSDFTVIMEGCWIVASVVTTE